MRKIDVATNEYIDSKKDIYNIPEEYIEKIFKDGVKFSETWIKTTSILPEIKENRYQVLCLSNGIVSVNWIENENDVTNIKSYSYWRPISYSKTILDQLIEDQRAIRKCIIEGGDLEALIKERNLKLKVF